MLPSYGHLSRNEINSLYETELKREHHLSSVQKLLEQRVCHTVALPFPLKSILKQKKTYEISNISPCKNIILKKILYKKPKSFRISSTYIK